MSNPAPVRPSAIAGSWYPADPGDLERELQGYLENAKFEPRGGKVVGLIAPHAGYFYSGQTAAYAYRTVLGQTFEHVAIFSPLHDYLPYDLLTSAHQSYTTPLGNVEIDRDLLELCTAEVEEYTGKSVVKVANDREHSLEIQLPFLQKCLGTEFSLLPFMVRTHDEDLLEETARALADVLANKNLLLVASTDLSHFYDVKDANQLDETMLEQMTRFSPEGVLQAEHDGSGSACGAGAVALTLWLARFLGADKVTLLKHATSADASGDTRRVVGYGAAVITRG
jgi:MEMO1 family protein